MNSQTPLVIVILVILSLIGAVFVSAICSDHKRDRDALTNPNVVKASDGTYYEVINIDSCQYLRFGGHQFSHRGNCTNCFRLKKLLEQP